MSEPLSWANAVQKSVIGESIMRPLDGIRIVTLALNLPGPLAVAQLHRLGATVVKVEPPTGDAVAHARPEWYASIHQGVAVCNLDLRDPNGQQQLESLLGESDLLISAMRLSARQRLGLDWPALHVRHPRICHVAIIGYPAPHEDQPGHDLTFQARAGLLDPPRLPRACLADFGGALQVVCAALALLLARERGEGAQQSQVSLAAVADEFAAAWKLHLTTADGVLGGACAGYNLYQASEGWVALAALEPHFWKQLVEGLDLPSDAGRDELERAFQLKTAVEWELWAADHGLPLVAVENVP
jgi:crotonobetainyl-CoA:carnitine CoA-transferase CaiB-like acyl-CoA transferase